VAWSGGAEWRRTVGEIIECLVGDVGARERKALEVREGEEGGDGSVGEGGEAGEVERSEGGAPEVRGER
jgi:hypothetical protein